MHVELAASVGAVIVHAATVRGVSAEELRRITGFELSLAADPDARISLALETQLWDEAARLADDDAIGLHAAELVQTGAFDAMDYAIRTAPTFGAAIERLLRYNRLVHDAAVYTLQRTADAVRVEHSFHNTTAEQSRHSAEFTLGAFVVIGSQILGSPLRPTQVEFRTAAPARRETLLEHRRVFGLEPQFSRPVNAIELAGAELERPLVSADPALSRLVERLSYLRLCRAPRRDRRHNNR